MRAFLHFYLTSMFGDIPIATTSDYRINSQIPKTLSIDVLQQIISDLKEAKALLPNDYVVPERIRPNKATAISLLSRSYLYLKDWTNAETEAT